MERGVGKSFLDQRRCLSVTGTLKDGELTIFNGDPSSDLTYEYVYKK